MATPGSWIGKTPVVSETTSKKDSEPDLSLDEQIESLERLVMKVNHPAGRKPSVSKEVSETTRTSRPKAKRSFKNSKSTSRETSKTLVTEHAIHQNIATGIFWCDCEGFKSHNEQDANYHLMQNSPKQAKKPYIRKEHLTARPFADNKALQALRDSLPEATKYNPGKKPRKKENN